MKIIENKKFDEERALYNSKDTIVKNCIFKGEQDGESFLKECNNITVESCYCDLRYPFWHNDVLLIKNTEMTTNCRAALWYSNDITIIESKLHGIKALRECSNILITNTNIISPEFGWFNKNIIIRDSDINGEYCFMRCSKINMNNVSFKGKYSFQYIKDSIIENCILDTKDAFWHAKNVVVRNCTIKGEYLAWYSENVTFENCKIIGTQPLCYCKKLKLINCEMIETDLSFEKSDVEATITTSILSVKNPKSGFIKTKEIKKIILDDITLCKFIINKEKAEIS